MERLKRDGYSTVLFCMAKRIGNVTESNGVSQSVNVMNATVLNGVSGGEINTAVCSADLERLSLHLTCITIKSCKDYASEVLDFSRFTELKELKIENGCFDYPSKVRIEGMKHLNRVAIGSGCFTGTSRDSELVVKDCPELKELVIGTNSFPSFTSFYLGGLPRLKSLLMGNDCFKGASFTVRKMESIETIQLGTCCFEKSLHTVIEGSVKGIG